MSEHDTAKDDIVSQAYQKLAAENPPAALDDAILAASRREVHSRPQSLFTKWKVPVSIAAVLTLSVSVIFSMYDQYGASLWKDDAELVSYDLPESASSNFIEPKTDAGAIEESDEEVQEQTVVVLKEELSNFTAGAAPASMVADAIAPIPAPSIAPEVAADDIGMQRQIPSAATLDFDTIKQKEQQLVAEISEMQSMQEELKRETLEITQDLQHNELKRSEMSAKVAALTKKTKIAKARNAAVAVKQKAAVQVLKDSWLDKIKSLWQNDNKELARIELKRYLETKKTDKAKLKGKLPAELLELDNQKE